MAHKVEQFWRRIFPKYRFFTCSDSKLPKLGPRILFEAFDSWENNQITKILETSTRSNVIANTNNNRQTMPSTTISFFSLLCSYTHRTIDTIYSIGEGSRCQYPTLYCYHKWWRSVFLRWNGFWFGKYKQTKKNSKI